MVETRGRHRKVQSNPAATPRDVVHDSRISKPRPEEAFVGMGFPNLELAMNRVFDTLVEVFGYPIHNRTLDVAYRTIAYQQHPDFVANPIPMVDFPETTVQLHYCSVRSMTGGVERITGLYWMGLMGERGFYPTGAYRSRTPSGEGLELPQGFGVNLPENIRERMNGLEPHELLDGAPVAVHREMQTALVSLAGIQYRLRHSPTAMRIEIAKFHRRMERDDDAEQTRDNPVPLHLE